MINASTTCEFIEKAKKIHGDKYDYSKVNYINSKTKVCIICPEHGEFWQRPKDHLQGHGCYHCGRKLCRGKSVSTETLIQTMKDVHNNEYDYSKVEYKGSKEKICIICPEHGEFWQNGGVHLQGSGCPKCLKSKLENEMSSILHNLNIEYFEQYKPIWLKNGRSQQSLDFYLPNYNIAVECQGEQHFKPIDYFGGEESYKECKKRDIKKNKICLKYGINIIYYFHDMKYDNFYTIKNSCTNLIEFHSLLLNMTKKITSIK